MMKVLKICAVLTTLASSANVFAHGDHTHITPSHSVEHFLWYGAVTMIVWLAWNLGKKLFNDKTDR